MTVSRNETSPADYYSLQMGRLAAIGANLCGYSSGDPEQWSKGPCDCKRLPEMFSVLWREQDTATWVHERDDWVLRGAPRMASA